MEQATAMQFSFGHLLCLSSVQRYEKHFPVFIVSFFLPTIQYVAAGIAFCYSWLIVVIHLLPFVSISRLNRTSKYGLQGLTFSLPVVLGDFYESTNWACRRRNVVTSQLDEQERRSGSMVGNVNVGLATALSACRISSTKGHWLWYWYL